MATRCLPCTLASPGGERLLQTVHGMMVVPSVNSRLARSPCEHVGIVNIFTRRSVVDTSARREYGGGDGAGAERGAERARRQSDTKTFKLPSLFPWQLSECSSYTTSILRVQPMRNISHGCPGGCRCRQIRRCSSPADRHPLIVLSTRNHRQLPLRYSYHPALSSLFLCLVPSMRR